MNEKTRPIAVLGAGNMGSALAHVLALRGARVILWDFFSDVVRDINHSHRNERYLPGITFPPGVTAETSCPACVEDAQLVILAVPSPFITNTVGLALPAMSPKSVILCAAKGIHTETQEPIHCSIATQIGERALVLLGGPAIANEFARGMPTSIVLAARSFPPAESVKKLLENDFFRVSTTLDLAGVALGGILKNVYVILLGYLDATAKAARNLQAAVLQASLYEMAALSVALGAQPATLYGLAGLGDLVATGFSDDSHNRHFGLTLGSPEAVVNRNEMLPEGARAAAAVCAWANRVQLKVPLAEFVQRIVVGERPSLSGLLKHL